MSGTLLICRQVSCWQVVRNPAHMLSSVVLLTLCQESCLHSVRNPTHMLAGTPFTCCQEACKPAIRDIDHLLSGILFTCTGILLKWCKESCQESCSCAVRNSAHILPGILHTCCQGSRSWSVGDPVNMLSGINPVHMLSGILLTCWILLFCSHGSWLTCCQEYFRLSNAFRNPIRISGFHPDSLSGTSHK